MDFSLFLLPECCYAESSSLAICGQKILAAQRSTLVTMHLREDATIRA